MGHNDKKDFFSLLPYLFINFFNVCVVKFMEMCFYKLHCWMFSILCTSTVQTFSATPHVFMFYFQGVRLSCNFFWAIVIEAFLRSFQVFLLDNASTPCTWPFSEAFYLLNHLILTYESINKAVNSRRWTNVVSKHNRQFSKDWILDCILGALSIIREGKLEKRMRYFIWMKRPNLKFVGEITVNM